MTARLARELRRLLHAQLDSVLDAGKPGHRVIDEVVRDAETGKVVTVSVHTLPPPGDNGAPQPHVIADAPPAA